MTGSVQHERVLIVAPLGRDAAAIEGLLRAHGYLAAVCQGGSGARREIPTGAGALILTEEALGFEDSRELIAALDAQPAWSELPLIVLASGGESRFARLLEALSQAAGSLTVLERPIATATLLRSVQAALRARRRQYQVRDLLIAQEEREAALRVSEERLRLALEAAELGSWDVNLANGSAVWNRRHRDLLGYGDDAPASIDLWQERVHADDRERVYVEFDRARLERRPISIEHRYLRPDTGELRWLTLYGRYAYDESGRAVRMVGVSRDTTAEKNVAELMRVASEDQARLAAIVSSTSDAVISEDLDGIITSWNRGAERLFGYRAEEIVGTPMFRLSVPEFGYEHAGLLDIIRQGRPAEVHETVRQKKDGSRVHVSIAVSPIFNAQGVVIGASKIARDVTDLVHARSMQRALTERLQEADRRKNDFLATLAHELRNPLAPIRTAAQLLSSPQLGGADLQRSRDIIQRQVKHMARLLEDLLDIARVTHGKLNLEMADVPLGRVLEDAVEAAQPAILARRHELTMALPEQAVIVRGDSVRLSQIFSNLLTNAAKYTPPGGRISLEAVATGTRAQVIVRDNGIGIPAESLAGVFDMFNQVPGNLGQSQGGLGIGLALTKSLVELHGGSISVESEIGVGSEFTVSLPVTLAFAEAPSRPNARPRTTPLQRVLVVDDNRDAADSLAAMLRAEGHTVAVAYDGLEAQERALLLRPEVAFLDLGMPRMDGYALAERLRDQPWGGDVRLIAVTGWGAAADRLRTRMAGFERHLVKPVELDEIHAVLEHSDGNETGAPAPAPGARTT